MTATIFGSMIAAMLRSAAAGVPYSPSDPLRWSDPDLLDDLAWHGILPLLYHSLAERHALPAEAQARLKAAYESALIYTDLALALLGSLREGMTGSGRVVLMQGLSLVEHLYKEPLVRPMSDIDLYLPDGNYADVCECLIKNGFSPYRTYHRVWTRKGFTIDLHEDFWGAERIPARAGLFKNIPLPIVASRIAPGYYTAPLETCALHAAFHGIKHGFAKAIWLFDLLLLYRSGVNLAALGDRDSLIGPVAHLALVEAGVVPPTASPPVSPVRRMLVRRLLCRGGKTRGRGELAIALLFPAWAGVFRYLAGSLVPPLPVLREMYGPLPAPALLMRRIVSLCAQDGR